MAAEEGQAMDAATPPEALTFAGGPPPPRLGKRLGPLVIGIIALVLAAAAGAGVFVFTALKGTGDVIDRLVPADTSVYVTAYLDPAAQQKLNLRNLATHFPSFKDSKALDRRIDELLDRVLEGGGLTSNDVRPWLGSQIAMIVELKRDPPMFAVLVASKDDAKAGAALAKSRSGPDNASVIWKETSHGGVRISVGSRNGRTDSAYAVVSHAVVLANDAGVIEDVVDSSQGKRPNLRGSAKFVNTTGKLPAGRLALAYVDFRPLIERIKQGVAQGEIPDLGQVSSSLGQLDAIEGLGATLSAEPTGLAADITMAVDRSKLPEGQQQAHIGDFHQNAVLSFTPKGAYGVLATLGFQETVRSAIDHLSKDPSLGDVDSELGLSAVLKHLTGEAGLEAGPSSTGGPPSGALLFGTDDEAAMRTFLDRLALKASEELGGRPAGRRPRWERETYRGVTISFLPIDEADLPGLTPAYAVTEKMGILASSPEEVRAVIDARAGGSNITSARNFIEGVGARSRRSEVLYLDVEGITSAIRDSMPPEVKARFDAETGKDLTPLKAFVMTSTLGSDQTSVRLFLLIR